MNLESVFYEGNINNPPVIFVHGFAYDHTMWDSQVDNLNNEFYCITYDIRGLGKSPAGVGQFTMEDLADDLIELASSLKYKPVVCGLSMGGYISLRAFQKSEDKFKGLILCDTKAVSDSDEIKIKRSNAISRINKGDIAGYIEEFTATCFSERYMNECKAEFNKLIEKGKSFDPIGVKGCLIAMLSRTDTTNALGKFDIPVLVLCGEGDKLCLPEDMRKMADMIRNSEFQIIRDAAHMTPIENPDRFNYLIKAFLHKIT